MKKLFFAAALFTALSGTASAALSQRDFYTDRCWATDHIPEFVELNATNDGVLLWNGTRTNWTTFRVWLIEISARRDPNRGMYVTLPKNMPHRPEIVSALAKGGLVLRRCKWQELVLPSVY